MRHDDLNSILGQFATKYDQAADAAEFEPDVVRDALTELTHCGVDISDAKHFLRQAITANHNLIRDEPAGETQTIKALSLNSLLS